MEQIFEINVKPNAKKIDIIKIDKNKLEVHLKSQPIKGAANKELIKLLSKHFKVAKTDIEIIKGMKTTNKLVKIYFSE
ncbi:MAG: DUF167 domain-containing protein [Candidatus Lokiarchaeota archaeon]|nr:DUF167 domain-containing protein [Candidatus Lokiarchaeota archaeon]